MLTVSALIPRLSAVTVAEVTGTGGPAATHIELDRDSGLAGRERSYVNATALHTVPKGELRRRRGRLSTRTLDRLDDAVSLYLDLTP